MSNIRIKNYEKFLKERKTWKYKFKQLWRNITRKRLSQAYKYGLLIGEIVWYKSLSTFNEFDLIEKFCTQEEKEEYNKLDKIWYKNVDEKKESKIEWENFRNYAKSLHIKYFPHNIEFSGHYLFKEYKGKQLKDFFKGIECYLWNTDNCAYSFSVEDIKLDKFKPRRSLYVIINFTLSYIKENNNKNNE